MNDLTIKQNTQIKETNVPASTITKLVLLSKSGTDMELVGWIGILGGIKKSEKDYMDQHYGNNGELLEWLTIDAPKIYLDFEDPAVETIMMSVASSDGVGVTVEDAAALLNNLFPSFENNTNITSFNELKEFTNVTQLTSNFRGCTNLTSVDLSNILYIGNLAFTNSGISGVINLPKFIKFNYSYPMQPFNNCNSITEINFGPYIDIANGISTESTLTNLTNLTKVTGLSNITNIGKGTFSEDINLEYIDLDFSKLSVLNHTLFRNCKKLFTNLDLSQTNITEIGSECFYGCTSLTSLTIPESVTVIQNQAFKNCTSLTSLTLSTTNSLIIKELCFSECKSLTSLTFPSNCRGFEHWQLPSGMLLLSLNISNATCALQQLNINTTNFDVILFSNSNLPLLELTVPDCCLYLDCSAITVKKLIFSQNSNLKGFCPVSSIKNYDSYDWDNFTSSDNGKIPDVILSNVQDIVNIPALKVIPGYFFNNSTKSYLTSNFINNAISNAVVIGRQAFRNMNPTSTIGDITIPSTVKFIGSSAFLDGYHKITSLTFQSTTPPEVEAMSFYDWGYGNSRFGGQKIYVPDAAVSDYQTAWTDYSSIIYPVSNKP